MNLRPHARPQRPELLLVDFDGNRETMEPRLRDLRCSWREVPSRDLAPGSCPPGTVVLGAWRQLPSVPGLSRLVRRTAPGGVLVHLSSLTPELEAGLILAGATGFLPAGEAITVWRAAIASVARSQRWFSRAAFSLALDHLLSGKPMAAASALLTVRERQIVHQVVMGGSNKDIARRFGVSESTVKNHLQTVFAKLGVSSRVSLSLLALHDAERLGLAETAVRTLRHEPAE